VVEAPHDAIVLSDRVNFRARPSAEAELLGHAEAGVMLDVLGCTESRTWWQLCCVGDTHGWVFVEPIQKPRHKRGFSGANWMGLEIESLVQNFHHADDGDENKAHQQRHKGDVQGAAQCSQAGPIARAYDLFRNEDAQERQNGH
jgi:uncharacterized protein YraI